ncbi:hypothetical protein [Sphingomonas sp. LHG3406-1]|uniref:hypothetical protein n=1 Tax=Sphingomonas sp. LHG3406-1 TaxID=2804617 RepID=UPI0026165A27|nr:hypothetical protein [Sphingomonas sp. LHG3406-1]
MLRNLFPLLAALPLLACTPASDKAETGEAIAEGAGVGGGPTGRVGNPVARGAERGPIPADIDEGVESVPSNTAAPARLNGIPAEMQGRWGLVAADCNGGAAAKGLLTIEERRLVFYESRGMLADIAERQPVDGFVATYAFTGEGQNWERTITFERSGDKLRRMEEGSEEGPVDLTYSRCPA